MKRSNRRRNPGKLTKLDYEALAQIRYLFRQFASFSEAAARAAGLTTQQHQTLLAIYGFPGPKRITIGALAERLSLRHHSVVGLIDRLAAKALVRRHRDPNDIRRVLLKLTSKGHSLLIRLSRVHRAEMRRLAPMLKQLLAQVA